MARVAILNSRQSKTPTIRDEWVSHTFAAISQAQLDDDEVVSSIGQFTWDLVSWDAFNQGLTLHIVLPRMEASLLERLASDIFGPVGLEHPRIRWVFLDSELPFESKKWWRERDRRVIEMANVVREVSIRPGGGLRQLLDQYRGPLRYDGRFYTTYDPESHHLRIAVDPNKISPAVSDWPNDFLIHWTRASHGPWPGETGADYFQDFVEWGTGPPVYCRSALKTIQRIIAERRLRASSWRVGSGAPMVAFTECSPLESLPLIRWRPRWSRWSFEPYGIAFHRGWLEARGAKPVRYVDEPTWKSLHPEEKPWCHRSGGDDEIWPAEREWRIAGDLDFRDIPSEACRLIVRTPEEAHGLASEVPFDIRAVHR